MAKREKHNRIRNGKIRRDFKRLLAIIADVRGPDYAEVEEIARRNGFYFDDKGGGEGHMSEQEIFLTELANDIEREVDAMLNEDKVMIGFKRLSDDAILPTKAHPTDSGYDLYAAEDVIIEPGETAVVPTGIAVQLPPGYEAQVRPRSGVTSRTKLRVQLGTVDNGYNGEIGVIVDNIARYGLGVGYYSFYDCDTEWGAYKIRKGDRIAQLVIQPLPTVVAYEVDGELKETDRGEGGFGSTGVREDD